MVKHPPAEGERMAISGYYPQYEIATYLIYKGLLDRTLKKVVLVDPKAGRVDDIQIYYENHLDAYQVKWSKGFKGFSYRSDLKKSIDEKPNLIKQLADGWKKLQIPDFQTIIHLYTNSPPSNKDLMETDDGTRPQNPRHFEYFIRNIWNKAKENPIDFEDTLPNGWKAIWEEIKRFTELDDEEFNRFILDCELDLGQELPQQTISKEDFAILYHFLLEKVSESEYGQPVVFNRGTLISELGWKDRFTFRSNQNFIIEEYYKPLDQKISEFYERVTQFDKGYLAVVGPPGIGKSSFLSHLKQIEGMMIYKYFINIEGSGETVSYRAEAQNFLHDLLIEFENFGYKSGEERINPSLPNLQKAFKQILEQLYHAFIDRGQKTIIIIDGIDHIEREKAPQSPLTSILLDSNSIPLGVYFVIGTQTLESLSSGIAHSIRKNKRIIQLNNLTKSKVFDIIQTFNLPFSLNNNQKEMIFEKTNGHPLALTYLLQYLSQMEDSENINQELKNYVTFQKEIDEVYIKHWDVIKNDAVSRDFLGQIARFHKNIDLRSIPVMFGIQAIPLINKFKHYFRIERQSRLFFFHSSFREFLCVKTQEMFPGISVSEINIIYHKKILKKINNLEKGQFPYLKWELIYHYHQAGFHQKVLEIANQEYFRNQLINFRPIKHIETDIQYALDSAEKSKSRESIVELILAGSEIHQRNEKITHFYEDLYDILLSLKKLDLVLDNCREGYQLFIPKRVALKLIPKLLDYISNYKDEIGQEKYQMYKNQARILFNLAEPSELFYEKKDSPLEEDYQLLIAWIGAAVNFYHINQVLRKLEKVGFLNQDDLFLKTLFPHFNVSNSEALILEDLLDTEQEDELLIWCEMQLNKYNKLCQNNLDLEAKKLLHKVEGKIEKSISNLPLNLFVKISKIYLSIKEFSKIKSLFNENYLREVKDIKNFLYSRESRAFTQFYKVFDLIKILYSIDKLIDENINNNRSGINERLMSAYIFRDAMKIVAWLYGKSLSDKDIDINTLILKINEIFNLFKEFLSSDPYKISLFLTPWDELFHILIYISGLYFRDDLNTIKDIFLNQWHSDNTEIIWKNQYKRTILSIFNHFIPNNQWVLDELNEIEREMLDGRDGYGRLQELINQSKIYIKINEMGNVERILKLFMEETLRIGFRKDFQMNSIIRSCSFLTKNYSGLFKKVIKRLGSIIPLLDDLTEGPAEYGAAEELLRLSISRAPSEIFQIYECFLENRSITFFSGLSSILISALKEQEISLELIKLVIEYYYLPLAENAPIELIKILIKTIHANETIDVFKDFINEFILNIKKFSLPSNVPECRAEWFKTVLISVAELGISTQWLSISSSQIETRYNKIKLELEGGNEMDLIQVLNYVENLTQFTELWSKTVESDSQLWVILIKKLSNQFSNQDLREFIKLEKPNENIQYQIAKLFKKRAEFSTTRDICLNILNQHKSMGWPPSSWWYPNLYKTLTLLAKVDPSQIDLEIIPFLVKISSFGTLYIHDKLYVIDRIIAIFLINNDDLKEVLLNHIIDYLDQLFYNLKGLNFNFIVLNAYKSTPNNLTIKFLLKNLEYESRAIQQMSSKICFKLLENNFDEIQKLININLQNKNKDHYRMLEILYTSIISGIPINQEIINLLKELFILPNIFYKYYISKILTFLKQETPSLDNLEIVRLGELVDLDLSFDEINPKIDRITNFFHFDFLVRLSLSTGISLYSLKLVLYTIINRKNPKILWDGDYDEKRYKYHKSIGLNFQEFKSEFIIVRQALYQLIGYLVDGLYISDALINQTEVLVYYDPDLFLLKPILRPEYILKPKFEEYSITEEKFLNKIELELNHTYSLNQDDRIILAEFSRYRFLNRPEGIQERKNIIIKNESDNLSQDFYKKGLTIDDYRRITSIKSNQIIIQNEPLWGDMYGSNWIAINPILAKSLGWKLSENGLFRWVNNEREIMIETLWWVDGFIETKGVHFCTVGEGWILSANKKALNQIYSSRSLKRIVKVKRIIQTKPLIIKEEIKELEI